MLPSGFLWTLLITAKVTLRTAGLQPTWIHTRFAPRLSKLPVVKPIALLSRRIMMTCSRLFPLSLYLTILVSCSVPPASDSNPKASPIVAEYSAVADKLIAAALADSFAYNRLAELTDSFGPRFSGTKNLEDAKDKASKQYYSMMGKV